jgi:hypothetical protein
LIFKAIEQFCSELKALVLMVDRYDEQIRKERNEKRRKNMITNQTKFKNLLLIMIALASLIPITV